MIVKTFYLLDFIIFWAKCNKMAQKVLLAQSKPNFFIIFLSCSQGGAWRHPASPF